MPKRISKAEQILSAARARREFAKSDVQQAERVLATARAIYEAHSNTYEDLGRALAPKPRTKPEKPAPVAVEPDKDAKCGICGNVQDHSDHDRSYLRSHDFEPPKSAARAGRRSSRKGSGTSSEASTANEAGDAIAVGGSGD